MAKTPEQRTSRRNQKRVSGAVRNILCNEFGLSKPAVLKDILNEVRSVATQVIGNQLNLEGMLAGFVSQAVYGKWNSRKLSDLIEKEVDAEIKRQVSAYVKQELAGRLKITIEEVKVDA